MVAIYDVLKASKGIHVDDTFAELWGRKLSNAYTVATYIGTLPATLQTVEGYLESYRIYGNTVQDGTPTPENPIMPSGCGVRTENFWDFQPSTEQSGVTLTWNGAKIVFSGICTSSTNFTKTITLSAGTYTIKANANRIPVKDDNSCIDVYKASPYMMAKVSNRTATNGIANFTLGEEMTVILRIRVQADVNYDGFTLEPMLNTGSTALPYEPYGYKLPILSNSTVTNIYLGEVETTRRIKELVFDGTENWEYQSAYTRFMIYLQDAMFLGARLTPMICTHYINIDDGRSITDVPNNAAYMGVSLGLAQLDIKTDGYTTAADFKAYLAAQYANGTPVTVWYVLAEPETAVVNEPLMKINDYADTIDSTQTSAQIPTAAGETTISWAGEGLAPSEVELTYRKPKGQ